MKKISTNEAKHIVLTYLMGYASASMNKDCDFYEEIPSNYILDETKLESSLLEHIGIFQKEYYPTDVDIKVICGEFEKVFYSLLKQKQTCIKRYKLSNKLKTRE
jgi:hypothetical protein